jgi:hypothetical protein
MNYYWHDIKIIHNPGTIPDARYLNSCNLTVVFEGTYSTYQIYGSGKTIASFHNSAKCERDALAVVIHGMPSTLARQDQTNLITGVREVAGSLFVTGLKEDYYASFWDGWGDFVADLD